MKQYLLDTNICAFMFRGKYGVPIDDFDLFIGATALAHNFVLVTENIKHLGKIKGTEIENWIKR